MDENKFFKWIWRFNALAIFVALLIMGALILEHLYQQFSIEEITPTPVINLAEDPEEKEMWQLGEAIEINGSGYVLMPLVSQNNEAEVREERSGFNNFSGGTYGISGGYYYPQNPTKNILFLNTQTNESYWMFENANMLIYDIELYPRFYTGQRKDYTTSILYKVRNKDSNKDGVVNKEDRRGLAISDPLGKKYSIVLDEYDSLMHKQITEDDRLFLVYQLGDTGFSLQYDMQNMKLISKKELLKVGEK